MLTYFCNIILLIITFLPKYKNISIFDSFFNDDINYPLKQNTIKQSNNSPINLDIVIQFLQTLKVYPSLLKNALKILDNSFIEELVKDYFVSEDDYEFIYNITNDLKNNSNCFDDLIQIIEKNNTILDDVIEIINIINTNKTISFKILEIIEVSQNILSYHEEFFVWLINFIKKYPDLFNLLRIVKTFREIDIDPFIQFIKNNLNILFDLFINMLRSFSTDVKQSTFISEFIINNKDKSLYLINLLRNNTEIFEFFIPLVKGEDIIKDFIAYAFKQKPIMSQLLDMFYKNETLLIEFAKLIGKVEDPEIFIIELQDFVIKNTQFVSIATKIILSYLTKERHQANFAFELLRKLLITYANKNRDILKKELSEECIAFLEYAYLGYVKEEKYAKELGDEEYDKNMSYYSIYKTLIDTTKGKNDLLTFENCLYNPPSFIGVTESKLNYMDINPIFIVSLVDISKNKNAKKNITYFDKYSYIFGICFPQGKNTKQNSVTLQDGRKSYYHCTTKDYKYIMLKILESLIDVENIKLDPIEMQSNEVPDFSWIHLIPFFIFTIPIFIYLILYIYKQCSNKSQKKLDMFYKNEEKLIREIEIDYDLINDNNNYKRIKKISFCFKWYFNTK